MPFGVIGQLALEFLDYKMTSFEELCGKGKNAVPFDECPVDAARDYSCEDADITLQLRARFEPQLEAYALTKLFHEIEMPLIDVLADMEWTGVSIDTWQYRSPVTESSAPVTEAPAATENAEAAAAATGQEG